MRAFLAIVLVGMAFTACKQSVEPKIPNIKLLSSSRELKVNLDTMFIQFSLTDGDADIANDSSFSGIYLKDSRYDTLGYQYILFPEIDASVEDPTRGLTATVSFYPFPSPVPRLDSLHMAVGDTLVYELYVKDRMGHESNHLVLPQVILKL